MISVKQPPAHHNRTSCSPIPIGTEKYKTSKLLQNNNVHLLGNILHYFSLYFLHTHFCSDQSTSADQKPAAIILEWKESLMEGNQPVAIRDTENNLKTGQQEVRTSSRLRKQPGKMDTFLWST